MNGADDRSQIFVRIDKYRLVTAPKQRAVAGDGAD